MNKKILITAALLGLIAIVLGAFGAHGLKELISVEAQQTFETGVRYQMYQAFFLLFVGSVSFIQQRIKKILYYLTIVGVILFSGSIYSLATNDLTVFDFNQIAMLTPFGGLCIIVSWGLLIVNLIKKNSNN